MAAVADNCFEPNHQLALSNNLEAPTDRYKVFTLVSVIKVCARQDEQEVDIMLIDQ